MNMVDGITFGIIVAEGVFYVAKGITLYKNNFEYNQLPNTKSKIIFGLLPPPLDFIYADKFDTYGDKSE